MYSVVVPTFNRAPVLLVALDNLLAQEADFLYEIIVVDNNSSDETRSTVQTLSERERGRLWYVFEEKQGLSVARNAGIAASRGEIVVFVDDDVIVQPGWLKALGGTYRTYPDAWCVGGKVTLHLPDPCPSWFDPDSGAMTSYLSLLDYGRAPSRSSIRGISLKFLARTFQSDETC